MSQAPQPGVVLWITGLSGAGKSTLAKLVVERVRERLANVFLLDGDVFREIIGDQLGHDRDARLENAKRIARLARHLGDQGVHVVCATMSLFHEVHAWNRAHMQRYFEVYVRVPLEELERRDAKGLYARARRGEARGVVGIDLPPELPMAPDLILDNADARTDLDPLVQRILEASQLS